MSFGLVMSLTALAERLHRRGDQEDAALINAAILAIEKEDAEQAAKTLAADDEGRLSRGK